jgi:hypothetical protein
MGDAYLQSGQIGGAVASYEAGLAREPGNVEILQRLAVLKEKR